MLRKRFILKNRVKIISPFIIILLVSIISCTNPLKETLNELTTAKLMAEMSPNFGNRDGIDKTTTLIYTFSKNMIEDSLTLSGEFASEGEFEWIDNKTVHIKPITTWTVNSFGTLRINCMDTEGIEITVACLYGILDHVIYVSTEGGSSGTGVIDDPLNSIEDALQDAYWLYQDGSSVEIRVAEGKYYPSNEIGVSTVLHSGINLNGGWSRDFSKRDPEEYYTVLNGQSDEDSEYNITLGIVDCDETTYVQGFTIIGIRESDNYSTTLYLESSSANIIDNKIISNVGTSLYSYNSDFTAEDNIFTSFNDSSSLLELRSDYDKPTLPPIIRGNTIISNNTSDQSAILLSYTDAIIENNKISMSFTNIVDNIVDNIPHKHIGILNKFSNPIIRNNIIDTGFGSIVCIKNLSSSPKIYNNTFIGSSGTKAVYKTTSYVIGVENSIDDVNPSLGISEPEIINNIFISGGENKTNNILVNNLDDSQYSKMESNSYTAFDGDNLVYPDTNINNDELYNFVDSKEWTLFDNAPIEIRTGASDLSTLFTTDMLSVERPDNAWSRGALQWTE